MKKLKIVSISSELDPFVKTGGLGDVARALPKSLARLGHEVIVIIPYHSKAIDSKKYKFTELYKDVSLRVDKNNSIKVSYFRGELLPNLPVYFVKCDKYFGKKKNIYGSSRDNARFYLFSVAALKLISLLKFKADIIHCHDWHTGLIPYLKKTRFKDSQTLSKAATVFTIHNLTFQLGSNWWDVPVKFRDKGKVALPDFGSAELAYINFAKRGIMYADVINTVSETYAKEILKKSFGQDLHRILVNRRHKLFGVVNGIDYYQYNPKTDKGLIKNYTVETIHRKLVNKRFLQKLYHLPSSDNTPLICLTSRLVEQKGFDLIIDVLPMLLLQDVQVIILGSGDKKYVQSLNKLAKKYSDKLVVIPSHKEVLKRETLVYAGSDFFLLPSRFEPCGINQLISFRYGCVPIVRATGGLSDTVINFDPKTDKKTKGNGFNFKNYKTAELLVALTRALETYHHRQVWKDLIRRGMSASFSWDLPARKYLELYKKAKIFKDSPESK
ncbi:glycogen synthase [Patescibacteria group bacterium]|nr:glycogen synthase [Patescibacteria group bacterium]